jgi:hypothetical protein
MKDKIIKHLAKAKEEIDNILDEAMLNATNIENIDLEYMGQQVDDLIVQLEEIDDIEFTPEEEDLSWMDDDDEDYDDNY